MVKTDLGEAINKVLDEKAERFIRNPMYLDYIRRCVNELKLTDPELAFLCGALDAMQYDFGTATQMIRPPASEIDVSFTDNRIERLLNWLDDWKARGILPF